TPIALVLPLPVQIVVDSVIGTHPAPGVVRGIVPASMQTPGGLLVVACVLLVIATLLQQAEGFGSWMLQLYSGERMVLDFRGRLFHRLQRLSLTYHDRQGTADSLYRLQNDASTVQYLIIGGLLPLFTS